MNISFHEIVKRISKLNILHRMHIHKQASKNGLHLGQLPILEYIIKHDRCTQREVADYLGISPPSVATSVKRMQKAGLLEKEMDTDDLRYNRITITEKGINIAKQCRNDFDEVDTRLFDGFSPSECEQLRDFFDRMIHNMATGEFENKSFFSLLEEAHKIEKQGGIKK